MKALILLRRAEGMSREGFADWWLNRHRLLAERLPGLLRHSFNLLPENALYDAVVEQWFVSTAAAETCYRSPEGEAVVADSAAHVRDRLRMIVEEHHFEVSERLDRTASAAEK